MSAKSKKRLCKLENKLQKLEKLELKDVLCPICQSILIEPVTLPCFHDFCQRCFNGSVENNALCCPLCRLRIGSWLRKATKQRSLVNLKLWNFIQSKFEAEITTKLKGEDIDLPEEKPLPRLSAPGEIRSEYEAELQRLRAERMEEEKKHIQKTELLIKQIQDEEHEAQQKYLERLKEDELLAKQLLEQQCKPTQTPRSKPKQSVRTVINKSRLKPTKIDGYLAKIQGPPVTDMDSPMLTDDNTSTDESTPKSAEARPSPEVAPSYRKLWKTIIDKKIKSGASLWNKENGKNEKKEEPSTSHKEEAVTNSPEKEKPKDAIKSLLVSLPLPSSGVLQHKNNVQHFRHETGSVDSMRQELCFFKPIAKTSTSVKVNKGLPIRVPCIRAAAEPQTPPRAAAAAPAPSRAHYLDSLCRLRNLSLTNSLPSAFVIALNILTVTKENPTKCDTTNSQPNKKISNGDSKTHKKVASTKKTITRVPNSTVAHPDKKETNLRRTRSMGSLSKDENETTPKKARIQRKTNSERKPYLRSDSKKQSTDKSLESPIHESVNNNKVNYAVKNLSSPLKNCDVKKILEEQLRIEKMIEQEKQDLEIARRMDAEWNGRRHLRRAPGKRQVTLNYALRPAKKLKV